MIKLDWRETEDGWFASHPIGNGRCVEVSVNDDLLIIREGSLDVDIVLDVLDGRDDAKRLAEKITTHFVTFADAVGRTQWAFNNLRVVR